jgi:hypothetical protein
MNHYSIQINASPAEKWGPILDDFEDQIKSVYRKLKSQNSGFLSNLGSKMISLSSYFGFVKYADEISYITERCGIPFGEGVLLQIMYELSAACTSAVFMVGDVPVHFRTMDWPLNELKKMTITIDFKDGEKTVYSVVTWAGYIGAFTAIKPGVCSISLNYREGNDSLSTNLANLIKSYWPAGYLIRDVMESGRSYHRIFKCLKSANLVAPCYFIICGINKDQCFNIVRDRQSAQVYMMDTNNCVVQTNIDPNSYDYSSNILHSIKRRSLSKQIIAGFSTINQTNPSNAYSEMTPPTSVASSDCYSFDTQVSVVPQFTLDALNSTSMPSFTSSMSESKSLPSFTSSMLDSSSMPSFTSSALYSGSIASNTSNSQFDQPKINKSKSLQILSAFSVHPIINEETVYMCLMVPQDGLLDVKVI